MSEVDDMNYDNADVESFVHNLGLAIYDLNKKHNDVLHRTNLGNALTPFIVFINKVKKSRNEEKKNAENKEEQ